MASKRDRSDELRALATVLYRLMREHEIANTTRIKVNSTLGRILNHSPEYRRLGVRAQGEHRKAKDPGFFTLVDIAHELKVPLCTLVPTIEHQAITDPQREILTLFSRWVLGKFAKHADERAAYTSDFEDFEAYVTIRKQAYPSAAGPVGTDEQSEPDDVDVLKSIPGVHEDRFQVITVPGDSMYDRLHAGDRVLIDIFRRTPLDGEIVVVDRRHLGRTIGYWHRHGNRCFLEKHNEATIDLGPPDDWQILGTITRIVDAPLHRRERKKT
jgi:phage repressor protein C with HTH and peptisase S24 domain